MTTKDEALKLALEALERVNTSPSLEDWHHAFDEEVTAIREALAEQPAQQQEPVAKKTRIGLVTSSGWDSLPVGTEFFTSPPAQRTWVGLTDEEWQEIDASLNGKRDLARIFTRAIEAKLKEKNQ